jgi:hypothetical protein
MKKAQISVEYLIVLGLSLALIITASYIFYMYSKSSNDNVVKSEITNIGKQILTNAESIYSLGQGSKIRLDLNIPEEVKEIEVLDNSELVIVSAFGPNVHESVFFSDIPINGTIDNSAGSLRNFSIGPVGPGTISVSIESKGRFVEINVIS